MFFYFIFCRGSFAFAESPQLYISEINWVGSQSSSADEWLELYNSSAVDIDLSAYELEVWSQSKNEYQSLKLSGVAKKGAPFLIANNSKNHNFSKGESVLAVDPDLVNSKLTLSNSSLELKLLKGSDVVDKAGNKKRPFSGGKHPFSSMARKLPLQDGSLKSSWYQANYAWGFDKGADSLGTPGLRNISLPDIAVECEPQKLIAKRNNDLKCRGKAVDFQNEKVKLTVNGKEVHVESGEWSWAERVKTKENSYSLKVVAANQSGLKRTLIKRINCYQLSDKVYINEVYPNPESGAEWVEIINLGNSSLDLSEWYLDDKLGSGSKSYQFPAETVLPANGFLTVEAPQLPKLNNSGDEVYLLDPNLNIVDGTQFAKAEKGFSWSRQNERAFFWTETATKNKPNVYPERKNYYQQIKINEILPNPSGPDESNEWIEIKSFSKEKIFLKNWILDDGEGGSSKYLFGDVEIKPGEIMEIKRSQSGIALNNDSDSVRIFSPDGVLVDEVSYTETKPQMSYALFNGDWSWSNSPTPGLENVLVLEGSENNNDFLDAQNVEQVSATADTKGAKEQEKAALPVTNKGLFKSIGSIASSVSEASASLTAELSFFAGKKILTGLKKTGEGKILGAQSRRSSASQPLRFTVFFAIIFSAACGVYLKWNLSPLIKKLRGLPKDFRPG